MTNVPWGQNPPPYPLLRSTALGKWFPTLAAHWSHSRIFVKLGLLDFTPRKSYLFDLGWKLGTYVFKVSQIILMWQS